ncbi:MAG: hypothetical protein ABI164_10070 [Acidobacteriaceae bacterium]
MAANVCVPKLAGQTAKSKQPQPEARIPVTAMGYMPPGSLPAFDSKALVGVHFIDATHLLFTFGVKGLLHREGKCSGSDFQRIVRAVVLDVPSGKIERHATWRLYDFADYLWSLGGNLGGGKFLLRRCSQLDVVDAALEIHPLIAPSGTINAVGFSPDRSVLVVQQDAPGPATRPKSAFPFAHPPVHAVDVNFIQLQPLAIVARSRIPVPAAVPIVKQGILEALMAPHNRWTINLQPFHNPQSLHGAARKIATLRSSCMPRLTPLTDAVVVATICSSPSTRSFQAFDLSGTMLWQLQFGRDRHQPRFLLTRTGAHFAIESLHANRSLAALDPLNSNVIDAEAIDVYDTQTGTRIGGLQTMPIYTAGTNVDFSPDGTRLAVLRNGAIEIYTLKELAKDRE